VEYVLRASDYALLAVGLLQLIWAWRLRRLGLVHHYPFLFTFLIFSVVIAIGIALLYELYESDPRGSIRVLYGWFYVVVIPLGWTLQFCVVVEIFERMLGGYRGFQRLGQRVIYGALAATALLYLSMMFFGASQEKWMQFWGAQRLNVNVSFTVFCLLLALCAAYFRLKVPRNTRVVFGVFFMLFLAPAVLEPFRGMQGSETMSLITLLISVLSLLCILAGTMAFSAAGELDPRPVALRGPLDPQVEAGLTQSLQSFNNLLIRILKS
jgi:hypothetical protein